MQLADLVALEPEALRCPAQAYGEMREQGVRFAPEVNAFLVTRHEDVVAVLRDGKRFSSANVVGNPPAKPEDDGKGLRPLLLMSDDPIHARRRSIVNRVFTPARVAAWEPQVREIAEQYVQALRDSSDVDLVRDVSTPLPIRVITMLLGVPHDDVDKFRGWSEEITSSIGSHDIDPARRDRIQNDFASYIGALIDQRTGEPTDVLGLVAQAERQGELNRHECARFVIELLIAGNITTTHHLSSTMALLARTPELFDTLRAEPDLIPRFIEESLRLESPIQCFYRLATEDAVVAGTEIPAGSRLLVFYGSANHDPEAWDECPHMKLDRSNASAHVAFGKGAHACLGSSLARLEGRVVVETILAHIQSYEIAAAAEEIPYQRSFVNHGPLSLPAKVVFRSVEEPEPAAR